MTIEFHRAFHKQANNLQPAQKQRLKKSLLLFAKDPHNPELRNHPLKGQWNGHRSISSGGDFRAHYIVVNRQTVLFVALGTHSQLYG